MTNKKKKVLFFLPSTTGGAERMSITMAKMLPLDKFDVKFVIVHRNLGTIVRFIPEKYEIIHVPVHNIYCAATWRMIRIINKEKPDVVFSSLLYLNVRLIIAAKICGCKVIVRNNIDLSRTPSNLNPLLVKLTYRWADKVIAQQEEMSNEIIKYTEISPSKVVTFHNPIDIDTIDVKSKEKTPFTDKGTQIKYLWVARFSYEKGQDLLIKAIGKVISILPNAHLYLVGKYDRGSSYFNDINDYIKRHQLEKNVHFIGFDANPYRWVKNCDCYVMPSRLEGLPNSLIDAMYLRKPVVATKCIPVIERIVKDGYNGYLAENNNVDSIVEKMIAALRLKNFTMTYKPVDKRDIINLFATI